MWFLLGLVLMVVMLVILIRSDSKASIKNETLESVVVPMAVSTDSKQARKKSMPKKSKKIAKKVKTSKK